VTLPGKNGTSHFYPTTLFLTKTFSIKGQL
jgi:hypothetical protein